ncbi:MAG: rod shape-determining protein MreD [Thermoleophilia bacterium]|nr:rod shape-determining protein MreD [Thermoleophilia bacterium]
MKRTRFAVVGKALLLLVIAIALQTLVVSRISVLGVTADTFVIFTIVMALSRGPLQGAIFGFFAGIVADVAFIQPLGVHALVYVLIGYSVGTLVSRFGGVNALGVFLIAGGAALSAQILFGLFQFMMGPRAGFLTMLGTQMLPAAVLDALVTVPVYAVLVRFRVVPASPVEPKTAGGVAE